MWDCIVSQLGRVLGDISWGEELIGKTRPYKSKKYETSLL
jgi:hypothetical protein